MFAAKDRPLPDAAVSSRPVTFAAPARIGSQLRQDSQTPPFVFNGMYTLLPARELQHPCFQPFLHSLRREQNVTPVFSISPRLFLRSSTPELKLTTLFPCACALFCRYVGVARPAVMLRSGAVPLLNRSLPPATFDNCNRPAAVTYFPPTRLRSDRRQP